MLPDALAIEPHYASWYSFHDGVPGVQVHVDSGLTWMRLPVPGWSNGGVGLRFPQDEAHAVLGHVADQFDRVGVGFWVGPAAPATTEPTLRALGFRCRKRFPAMVCRVGDAEAPGSVPGLEIAPILDYGGFGPRQPHPQVGPVTTAVRRFEIARRAELVGRGDPLVELGAILDGELVGACLVFAEAGSGMASLHDVAVVEASRCKGIGRALVTAARRHAATRGCQRICLISTAMGESVYRRVGFEEVARIAYWYRGRG